MTARPASPSAETKTPARWPGLVWWRRCDLVRLAREQMARAVFGRLAGPPGDRRGVVEALALPVVVPLCRAVGQQREHEALAVDSVGINNHNVSGGDRKCHS